MTRQIALTQGKFTTVDDEDYEYLNQWKWYYNNVSHYVSRDVYGPPRKTIYMHCVLVLAPEGMEVDHADRNPLNNVKSNLRVCTCTQNNANRKKFKDSFSHFKGVSWSNGKNHWVAQISANGRRHYLGNYSDEISAAVAYDNAAVIYFGEFALLNFPFLQPPSHR